MARLLSTALVAFGLFASNAYAQSPKIFIASTGADSNDGSSASPKRSLQAAHDAVAAGGEVVILDTAGYGAVTITKSVGVVVPPGVNGFVTVTTANTNGITINAGTSDVVALRGLIVEGTGLDGYGNGIYATSVGTLLIDDTIVRNFNEGIYVFSTVTTHLVVQGGAVRNTRYGIDVEDNASNMYVSAQITETTLTGNTVAFLSITHSSGSTTRLVATRCVASANGYVFSVQSAGAQNVVDGCSITGNSQVFNAVNATNYSRGNNTIYNNTIFGPTSTTLAGQ